ncbi:MAG: Ig-like domain-containing protein [Chloroflexi bacterium]|nr:Ig-like domain-containing protein [Chloroflexota bacterium]
MKTTSPHWTAAALALVLATSLLARAEITHRYSFTADANDSVGTAHGTLQGTAGIGDGVVVLDGSDGSFVDLPGGLLDGYAAVTVEAWADMGVNGNWNRLFDFGDTNPDTGLGRNYFFFSPHSGAGDYRVVISDADPGYNHEEMAGVSGNLDNAGKKHIVCVVDTAARYMRFYIDGVLAASQNNLTIPLSAVSGALCYVGRSVYVPDPYLVGSIDEFRIYNHALTSPEIAASFAAGPEILGADPGPLQSVALELDTLNPLLGGFAQATVSANYANAANVNLTSMPGVAYQSSKTSIVTVNTNGLVRAVGLGSATVTVTYQGLQDSKTVTVVLPQAVLKHRYSFSESPGSGTVEDLVGTADGTLIGGATYTGDGKLVLDGADGHVDLPNGIISILTNATIEAWVTWSARSTWQRIFDFGSNSGGEGQQGTGQTYLFLTPLGNSGVVRFAATISSGGGETPVLNGRSALPIGQETHLAVVYNFSARSAKLFVNGQMQASGTASIPLRSVQDVNNWLGRSNWPDPYFNGEFNEFRIYDGALTDFEVALSAAAGPTKVGGTEPGPLQNIQVDLGASLFTGALAPVKVTANYANVPGVDVTVNVNTTYQTTDPNVLVVSTNGIVDAVGAGTAAVIASYQGKQATGTVTVAAAPGVPAKAELAHRYSFSETSGTTVKDSAGTADGTVVGTASFSGDGKLNVPGGGAGSNAGFVDLPNGTISQLTNATFEAWVTWRGTAFWERIFDFGSNAGGEDAQGTGQTYLFLSPRGGGNVTRFAITLTGGGAGEQQLNGPALFPANQETHVAVTYNYMSGNARLFINDRRVALGNVSLALSSIEDVNVWLGKSNWPDPFFTGQYNEFRIYNGALTEAEVAANFAAGPDVLPGQITTSPSLSIDRAGANLVVSWPTTATGFALEETSNLAPGASWTPVGGTPTVEGNQFKVTLLPGSTAKYYRLRK